MRLRGWDYPHLGKQDIGDGWVGFSTEAATTGNYEYCRLYQSGQFVHHFAAIERFHKLPWSPSPERFILLDNLLYQCVEIAQFASRLARAGGFKDAVDVRIELHEFDGAHLTQWDVLTAMSLENHVAPNRPIAYERDAPSEELVGTPDVLALEAAIALVEQMGLISYSRSHLAGTQWSFLQRALGA